LKSGEFEPSTAFSIWLQLGRKDSLDEYLNSNGRKKSKRPSNEQPACTAPALIALVHHRQDTFVLTPPSLLSRGTHCFVDARGIKDWATRRRRSRRWWRKFRHAGGQLHRECNGHDQWRHRIDQQPDPERPIGIWVQFLHVGLFCTNHTELCAERGDQVKAPARLR